MLIYAKLITGKAGDKRSWLGEVHQGGAGTLWTVLPSKKSHIGLRKIMY